MVDEIAFEDRDSQYLLWKKDAKEYADYAQKAIAAGKIEDRHPITGLAGAFSGAGLGKK